MLEALEVDVRRAALHRIREDGVEQLDDRRVLHLRLERGGGDVLFLLLDDLDVALGRHVVDDGHQVGDLIVHRRFVELVDRGLDRELPADDGEDVVARDELEILEHAEVRRIGHRDGERASVPLEREDEMLHREVGRDELGDARIDLEPRQIHRRHLVLPGEDLRELGLLNEAELDEVVADARSALLLLLERLVELLARDELLADEEIAEAFGGGDRSGHGWESASRWCTGTAAPAERRGDRTSMRLAGRPGDEEILDRVSPGRQRTRAQPRHAHRRDDGSAEKVTRPASRFRVAGPSPFTRSRAPSEPNAPNESRLATMRLASAGPTQGRSSISRSDARSRSTSGSASPAARGGRLTSETPGCRLAR